MYTHMQYDIELMYSQQCKLCATLYCLSLRFSDCQVTLTHIFRLYCNAYTVRDSPKIAIFEDFFSRELLPSISEDENSRLGWICIIVGQEKIFLWVKLFLPNFTTPKYHSTYRVPSIYFLVGIYQSGKRCLLSYGCKIC